MTIDVTGGDSDVGRFVVAMSWESYVAATKAVALLHRVGALPLKIRSGEHLAACVLAAVLNAVPLRGDVSGQVDLLFEHDVVEVKSIEGGWRKYEAEATVGAIFATEVRRLADFSSVIESAAVAADRQLQRKIPVFDEGANLCRHVVVVASFLDYFAYEYVNHGILGPREMPPLQLDGIVADYIWVISHPYTTQRWNRAEGRWETLLVQGCPTGLQVDTHEIERLFLDEAGVMYGESPFFAVIESLVQGDKQ